LTDKENKNINAKKASDNIKQLKRKLTSSYKSQSSSPQPELAVQDPDYGA
jgi:spore cortex formation protein SpoVR/YcgB (stage V sporulation)